MKTRDRLTATRLVGKEGLGWKEGEGTSQGTGLNDPQTQTIGWGLAVGRGVGLGGGEQRRKTGTTVIQ